MLYRKEGFGEENVRKIFTKMVEHHDALRVIFKKRDHMFIQYNRGLEGNLFELKSLIWLIQIMLKQK